MSDLAKKECVPCSGGTPPLEPARIEELSREVPEWTVVDGHHLRREFSFDDFAGALAFVNRVGELAEQENHHPDIELTYGQATVKVWTHKIDGLTESDFVLAAKVDQID